MTDGFSSEPKPDELKRDIEALLFAFGIATFGGVDGERAGSVGRRGPPSGRCSSGRDRRRVSAATAGTGSNWSALAGGWAFRTDARCHAAVSRLFEMPEDAGKLSPAAMECLAVVAYLQPVSRPQIAEIRGVNSDSTVRTLLERELITEVGRSPAAGGALLYGTTRRFEAVFGLAGPDELPPLEGFALTEDQKDDLRRRLGLLTTPE